MGKSFKGYSLLEIILVTSFIIIFIVVINPGTYIDRFSKILLKMNVLHESHLMVNKLNAISLDFCTPQALSSSSFNYLIGGTLYSLKFDNDQLLIQNLSSNVTAVLYKHIDSTQLNEFTFFNAFFSPAGSASDLAFINYRLNSSLMENSLQGAFICDNKTLVLGEY